MRARSPQAYLYLLSLQPNRRSFLHVEAPGREKLPYRLGDQPDGTIDPIDHAHSLPAGLAAAALGRADAPRQRR